MNDKEALQEIVYMVNDYVNSDREGLLNPKAERLINDLVKFLEENVVHGAIDNNYK